MNVRLLPDAPLSDATELAFIDGRTFVNAAKHEQVAGRHAAKVERLRERVASLMLEEPSKTQGLYAAIDELQAEVERAVTYIAALGCGGYHDDCDPCAFVRQHRPEALPPDQ